MTGKLIFLDIDGTITMPGIPPSLDTIQAIQSARRSGNLVFLCTGRSEFAVDPQVANIGFDGGIYHAGGRVTLGSNELVNHPLPIQRTKELIQLLSDLHILFHLEAAQGLYSSQAVWNLDGLDLSAASSELLRQMESRKMANSKLLCEYNGEPVYKISFLTFSKEQQQALSARVPAWAKLVWFDNFFEDLSIMAGEISDQTVTKATAMEAICAVLHRTADDCIAFGDSMNDAEILEAAGIGIAMGNASDQVKAIADLLCEPCSQDGIAKQLRRFGLF